MKKEIREIQIEVKNPDTGFGSFNATVRDGELCDLDALEEEASLLPTVEALKAYVQFLGEVIKAMED